MSTLPNEPVQNAYKPRVVISTRLFVRFINYLIGSLVVGNIVAGIIQTFIVSGGLPNLTQLHQVYLVRLLVMHPLIFGPMAVLLLVIWVAGLLYERRLVREKEIQDKIDKETREKEFIKQIQGVFDDQREKDRIAKREQDRKDREKARTRRINQIIGIVITAVVTSGILIQQKIIQIPVPTPTPTPRIYPSVTLYADISWKDTGISIKPGDRLTVTYENGGWTSAPKQLLPDTEADGMTSPTTGKPIDVNPKCNYCGEPLPTTSTNALIGRIGNGSPFLVGNSYITTRSGVTQGGDILLEINDNPTKFGDNTGSVTVQIIITP